MPTRRRRVWTNTDDTKILTVAGAPGQKAIDLSSNLLTGLGLAHLAGYTVAHTHVEILAQSDVDETGVSRVHMHWGIGIFAGGIDDGDFPLLDLYEGDWLAYGSFLFKLAGAGITLVLPTEQSVRRYESRAMRKIDRIGEVPFLVLQQDSTQGVAYQVSCSQLWLMP